jgi:dienelactone hydrolase
MNAFPLRVPFPLVAAFLVTLASTPPLEGTPATAPNVPWSTADSLKKVLGVPDYARWRTIGSQGISSDGSWVTWVYRFTNVAERDTKPELHVLNVDTNEDVVVPGATGGTFSPDGRWIAYPVDSIPPRGGGGSAAAGGPGGSGGGAAAREAASTPGALHRVELRELATGATQVWRDMQSVVFNQASTFALVRNRPAAAGGGGGRGGPGGGRGGGAAPASEKGSDAILYDLRTGRSQLLASVGDAAFNPTGDLLAYTVEAEVRDGNGLFVVDLKTGATASLDNEARTYARLGWNDAGTGLAVLKGEDVPKMRERDNVLVVVPDVTAALADPKRAPTTLDTTAAGFPRGWVISERAALAWSEDGTRVFLGAMPQTAAVDTLKVESSDTTTDVDVWNTADRYIQSEQMARAQRDRNFTYLQAFDLTRGAFVPLADSTLRDLEISSDGRWAVGRDARPYVSDWKPDRADFYRVNTASGARTLISEGHLAGGAMGFAPDGRSYLLWKDDRFHAYDLTAGRTTALGAGAPVFADTLDDHPGPKSPWGVAGYTADGRNVIVEDRYDLWTLPLDGGTARNLTGGFGAQNRTALRFVRPEPADPLASRRARSGQEFDLSRPVTLSAFGELSKKAGYYRLANGRLNEVVVEDAMFATPVKAAKADRFLFTRQSFAASPDLFVSGPDFGAARRITDSNPHQAEYRWGRSMLFDFTDHDGHALQGLLWLPDDYEAGQKRPTLVTFYEKNSQILNRYPMPELFVSMGRPTIEAVSRGYIVMIPDIWYHTGRSHEDQRDAVESATRKVIEMGYADPARIGVHGHSYGGEGAAYIGTRSKLFAAVGEGAGVTDLYTDFSQQWGWSYQNTGGSGQNGNGYYIYGQGRWGKSPWEMPDVYRDQSALSWAHEAAQPILIMHGTADPTVSFNESLKFFNALRFNEKTAFMLAYPGEGHHLSKLGNRKDFTTRFFEFFDHYLKGAPAPAWMTDGRPYVTKAGDAIR